MVRLEDVRIFVRAAALGSFSQAAREADILPAQASAAIQRLERDLDTRLFVRSTRSLRLSAQGEKYLPFAQEMLSVIRAGYDSLKNNDDILEGKLKISLPSDIGRNILLPLISDFCQKHTKVSVKLLFSDEVSNIYRDPVDIAVRYGLLQNSSYVAQPLVVNNRRCLVASPDYIARKGPLETLTQLAERECLLYLLDGQTHDVWPFEDENGKKKVTVHSRFVANDADVTRRWAVAGLGIAYKSWLDVGPDIEQGRLIQLLPDILGEAAPLNFICPHRSQLSLVVRKLYHHLRDHFDSQNN
ncbi:MULTISPECIES: LysR family transcriptional regulator [Serratia]|uniref:LysR family transcriptional regulator n=1 Tax=Serratia TaxID=613 RepID=UPI0011F365BF|nr:MULTISPECIES: LysR family transcriptional regulator [Serratia]MBH2848119.1 LysR family transcriptional regulator [Serratia marcescens]MBH3085343.1 LysR family transcriptional regulator [Serratia marcescens]MBH3193006.1 LysR family transcriptional regulator [Serratia marcescens]MBK5605885.1 LysR family transcriptional regulator [Serratia marcescens]BEO32657.1 transcriptional regulator [Serratia marcescens]